MEPGLKALAHMENNHVLDQTSREQLVSLLYDILRRLFPPNINCPAANISDSHAPRQEGQLVFDPTIDAWEHKGIYPQGYAAVSAGNVPSPTDPSASAVPHFGRPGMDATVTSATPPGGAIIGGPPCTAFSRPWQPGYPTPQLVSMPPLTAGAPQCDDPWAMPEVLDPPVVARGSNPVLPWRALSYADALVPALSLELGMCYTFNFAESVLTNDQWVSLVQGHRSFPWALLTVVTRMGWLASFASFTAT